MALKKETIKQICDKLKIKQDDFEAAIKVDGEVDVPIDDKLEVLTAEEITTLKANEYKSGKETGVEMAVKATKEKLNLNFAGKTIDGLVEAAQKKALDDAKIEPDKKVQEIQTQLATAQATAAELQTKLAEKDSEVHTVKVNAELYKHIPAAGDNGPALDPDDVISLARANGYEFKVEDGKTVGYKAGVKQIDKLGNVRPAGEVLTDFMKEKKLIAEPNTPGGRGGGDQKPPVKAGSVKELKDSWVASGKSVLGQEFNDAVQAARKDNPEFKME